MIPVADLLKRLRHMADRRGRHDYSIGDYWNAVDDAADALEAAERERDEAREQAEEKRDIDELIAASVVRRESEGFAAECVKLQRDVTRWRNAHEVANTRAVRWEDKVQQYSREVSEANAERDAARAQVATQAEALKRFAGDCTGQCERNRPGDWKCRPCHARDALKAAGVEP